MKRFLTAGLVILISAHIASVTALADFDEIPAGKGHDGGYGLCVGFGGDLVAIGAAGSVVNLKDLWLYGPGIKSKVIGGNYNDYGFAVQATPDGYIAVGQTKSVRPGNLDVWLIKVDQFGNAQWQRTFGGDGDDCGFDVQQTRDGGYIIVGRTGSYGAGEFDVLLIKTLGNGELEWMQTFGGPDDDMGYSVQQTSDGGYILTGCKESEDTIDKQLWLIKTDPKGRLLWDRVFGGGKDDHGRGVIQTSDGCYVVAGWTESFSVGSRDAYLVKTDSRGNLLWEKAIGGKFEDCAQSIIETPDNLYVFTGWTWSYQGKPGTWLVALRPDGKEVEWNAMFYGVAGHWGYCVRQFDRDTFAIAGVSTGNDKFALGYDGFIIRYKPHGDWPVWYNAYDGGKGPVVPGGVTEYLDELGYGVKWETATGKLTLRNCESPTAQQTASIRNKSARQQSQRIISRTESPRDFLVRVLSNHWIATHRVYTTDQREFDAVLLTEKPGQLCLAKAGAGATSKFEIPKDSVVRIEPLVEAQVADEICGMLRMERKKFASDQQRQCYEDAIKELSERCCKYGAPYPGTSLVSVRLNEQDGEMAEAVLENNNKKMTVKEGDMIDDFTVMGRDAETNTVLLRMGEDGTVTRIWPAKMWDNLGSASSEEEVQKEPETVTPEPEKVSRREIPQNESPPPVSSVDRQSRPETGTDWRARLENLWNKIVEAVTK